VFKRKFEKSRERVLAAPSEARTDTSARQSSTRQHASTEHQDPAEPAPADATRWPLAFVFATMSLAALLYISGFDVEATLGLLAGAAGIGVQVIERLRRRGGRA